VIGVETIGTILVLKEFKIALGISSGHKKDTSQITTDIWTGPFPAESVYIILADSQLN